MPGHTLKGQPVKELIVDKRSIAAIKASAADCKACNLWENATQTVFGEGKRKAELMLVGEQPGNDEDLSGKPFVGPAGRLLDQALKDAGIDRSKTYVTNVVKHFKFEPRGKLRIHKKPNSQEINACLPWLESEIAVVKPDAIMLLGATAAQSLLGKDFRVTKQRGRLVESELTEFMMATVHPSSILRAHDEKTRHDEYTRFVDDLRKLARYLDKNVKK